MNSQHLSIYARIAMLTAVAGIMTACVSSPHYHDPYPYSSAHIAFYDYWYYPAIGAYYDPRAHRYIYYEHDHWIRARALPTRMRTHLGNHVTVRSPHDRPYEEHHRHRQQYQPERYRERNRTHQGDNVWIGAPLHANPQHNRDHRRVENHNRDRTHRKRREELERGTVPVPPHHREPQASTMPIKKDRDFHQPEIRKEQPREKQRNSDLDRKIDRKQSSSVTKQPRQYRIPESRGQHSKVPPRALPSQRNQTTRTMPAKQNHKANHQEHRKEDEKRLNREGQDKRGTINNDEDARLKKREPRRYEQYEQVR